MIDLSRENKRLRANNSQLRAQVTDLKAQRDAPLTALGRQLVQGDTERITNPHKGNPNG